MSLPALGVDGTVYVGSNNKQFVALNGTNGVLLWAYTVLNNFPSSPAIAPDGTLFVGNDDKSVYSFTGSGVLRWSRALGGRVCSSPAISPDNSRLFVGSDDGRLYCLLLSTGVQVWNMSTAASITSSPTRASSGVVIVGSADANVYGVDEASGM